MFSATEFTYDNIYSGIYGLKIASFNDNVLEETGYVVPTVVTNKPARSKKFYYAEIKYENAPTYEFTVVREEPIPDVLLREILLWLDSRKGFKTLIVHQPDFEGQEYKCIFTVTNLIYHAGNCVGIGLTATFDSIYQYAKPTIKTVVSDGSEYIEIVIINKSDVKEEYIYPKISFKTEGYIDDGVNYFEDGTPKCNISIFNVSDDSAREFKFCGIATDADISVDNELKLITSDDDTDLLSKFNLKWLRLKPGANTLRACFNGEVTIICPQYIKIRF